MVGELQIIFGLHAVALHLRVAGETLVFFQKLRGIAALPVVLAIAGTGIHVGRRVHRRRPGRACGRPDDC